MLRWFHGRVEHREGRGSFYGILLATLLFISLFPFTLSAEEESSEPARKHSAIQFIVSIFWEGRNLKPYNLEALQELRRDFSGINFFHFVSPAYFTKPGNDSNTVAAKIKSVIKPGDEVGLYLQPVKSITASAKIFFRDTPTFWGHHLERADCTLDCGHDVPLIIYPRDDLEKLVAQSVGLLHANGFGKPRSFTTGGWLSSQVILDAAARHGLGFNFSAVPPSLLKRELGRYPLYQWITQQWHEVTPNTQAFVTTTNSGKIVTIPNTAAAIDYLSPEEVGEVFKTQLEHKRNTPGEQVLFHLAMHQETALQNIKRFRNALQTVFKLSNEAGIPINPINFPIQYNEALAKNP